MKNKNKTIINSHIRPYIKQDLLDWKTINEVAIKYWVVNNTINKYYNSKAFCFKIEDWVKKRRCTNCSIYRTLDNFHSNWNTEHSQCIFCRNRILKNRYIINKVTKWKEFREQTNERFKRNYAKWFINVKRCTKRRVKNILANNFRILWPKKK